MYTFFSYPLYQVLIMSACNWSFPCNLAKKDSGFILSAFFHPLLPIRGRSGFARWSFIKKNGEERENYRKVVTVKGMKINCGKFR